MRALSCTPVQPIPLRPKAVLLKMALILGLFLVPYVGYARDAAMDRLAACNKNGGIFEDGQCIPPAQYRNATQKRLDQIKLEREQRNRRICATIKDPCAMPICKQPTTKCPDNMEAVRKLLPPMPELPRPVIGRPAISNLTGTGVVPPGGASSGGNANGGLSTVPPMGVPEPAQATPPQAPYAGIAVPPAGMAVPMTPPAVSPAGSTATGVTPGGVGDIKNRLKAVPQNAPEKAAEVPPEKDSKTGGGLPSWLRFGN